MKKPEKYPLVCLGRPLWNLKTNNYWQSIRETNHYKNVFFKKKTLFSAIRYRNIQNEKKSCLISYSDQTRWSTSATFHHLVTFYNSVFINLKKGTIFSSHTNKVCWHREKFSTFQKISIVKINLIQNKGSKYYFIKEKW